MPHCHSLPLAPTHSSKPICKQLHLSTFLFKSLSLSLSLLLFLCLCLCLYLSISILYLSSYLSLALSIFLFLSLSLSLSLAPSFYRFLSLSISITFTFYLPVSFHCAVHLSVYLCIHQPIYPSPMPCLRLSRNSCRRARTPAPREIQHSTCRGGRVGTGRKPRRARCGASARVQLSASHPPPTHTSPPPFSQTHLSLVRFQVRAFLPCSLAGMIRGVGAGGGKLDRV